jgi:hypothetical protein
MTLLAIFQLGGLNGVPDRTRTYYLKFRKLALYPDELPGLTTFMPVA